MAYLLGREPVQIQQSTFDFPVQRPAQRALATPELIDMLGNLRDRFPSLGCRQSLDWNRERANLSECQLCERLGAVKFVEPLEQLVVEQPRVRDP